MAEMIRYITLIVLTLSVCAQKMERISNNGSGICKGGLYTTITKLKELQGCVVILGHLKIKLELGKEEDYDNIAFRDLREITEYLVIYRASGLESVGLLFPNLTRIRGEKLLHNFALIVYDNPNLSEIGLYNLLKIERGGVIIWGLSQACFIDTIDWEVIAPYARHVITPAERQTQCNILCRCTSNAATNKCWNIKKCQMFTEGIDSMKCNNQCLGCRNTKENVCFVCRNYTYQGNCVSKCPSNSILLPGNNFCISEDDCIKLDQWVWNGTCVSECPVDYKIMYKNGVTTCEPCINCEETCGDLYLQSLSSIQNAERCVYVNGSLIIHMRSIPSAMAEMKRYLSRIQEIKNYISVDNSDILTSLDFLSSLRIIKGEKLKEDRYSLDIKHNINLQALFAADVTKNLEIKRGTARIDQNPLLCVNKIFKVKGKFPLQPNVIDIPEGANGYRSGCKEINFDFQIRVTGDTSVVVMFSPVVDHDIHYAALYIRLPSDLQTIYIPETCSEFEWHATDVPTIAGDNFGIVELTLLKPASTYALCIELYDPEKKRLIKSNMFNFSTPVGIPEPPFIMELVAFSSDGAVIRWVDHKDYVNHITYYQLDVVLIEIEPRKSSPVDHCKNRDENLEIDYTRHALVRRPPKEYNKGCESMCGILATVTPGAMVEDFFDVCDGVGFKCNIEDKFLTKNSSLGNYVRTLALNISSPRTNFQVGDLAPFSDYKFRLRACSGNQCSRSARAVVRTLRLKNADIATIISVEIRDSGNIYVEWAPPVVNNGPVLTYTIEVLPKINVNSLMPQAWCVLGNETRTIVKSAIANKYLVRVCVATLASSKSCTEWAKASNDYESKWYWLWRVAVCGMVAYIAFVVRWIWKRQPPSSDAAPLVDNSSSSRVESEPPILSISDTVPFHTVPLQ